MEMETNVIVDTCFGCGDHITITTYLLDCCAFHITDIQSYKNAINDSWKHMCV